MYYDNKIEDFITIEVPYEPKLKKWEMWSLSLKKMLQELISLQA